MKTLTQWINGVGYNDDTIYIEGENKGYELNKLDTEIKVFNLKVEKRDHGFNGLDKGIKFLNETIECKGSLVQYLFSRRLDSKHD